MISPGKIFFRLGLLVCACLAFLPAQGQSINFSTIAGNAGYGSMDGTGPAARFDYPQGIAVDSQGNVYLADSENNTIRRITPQGMVSTIAGSPGMAGKTDGTGASALFSGPRGVAIDASGNLYITDTRNYTIRTEKDLT